MTAGGITLAFDIYGTLANTGGVAKALEAHTKDAKDAAAFAARWRDKQLEYTFRRTAMGLYADFAQCTREALLFVCKERGVKMNDAQRQKLLAEYSRLPLFPDAKPALARLRQNGNVKMYAFSNGKAAAVEAWLKKQGIADYFSRIISADAVKRFKPAPQVYRHFLQSTKGNVKQTRNTYLISGNPFDIIGAQQVGIKGLWLNRTGKAVFDPWRGITPTKTISSLSVLANMFAPAKPQKPPQPKKPKQPNKPQPKKPQPKKPQPKKPQPKKPQPKKPPQSKKAQPNKPQPKKPSQPKKAKAKKTPAAKPVKIHIFIDMENNSPKNVTRLLVWLRQSGLSMSGKAVTAHPNQTTHKSWDASLNEYGIKRIETKDTGKDAADAVIIKEINATIRAQKAGDIICIVSADRIFNKKSKDAIAKGFRVMRFSEQKLLWNAKNTNYLFFKISDTVARKSKFPKAWKTRPAG